MNTWLILLLFSSFFNTKESFIEKHVDVEINVYQDDKSERQISVMPILKKESPLNQFPRRFEYLLMNVSAMHQPEKFPLRKKFDALYPDTTRMRQSYLNEFYKDEKLSAFLQEMAQPLFQSNGTKTSYTSDELMEVASRFFYCDALLEDSSVQAHICVGINGIAEAKWDKDYTLLAAFCYEAIFTDFENDDSSIYSAFEMEKEGAEKAMKAKLSDGEDYLLAVRWGLFERIKSNPTIQSKLVAYYERNQANLPFTFDKN